MGLDAIIKAGSVVAAIGGIGAGYYALDATYAREVRVTALEQSVKEFRTSNRVKDLQQMYWQFEDRYGKACVKGDKGIRETCRNVLQQLLEAQEELQQLRKK